MINTNVKNTRRWYYDAVVGYIIYSGYTRREAKRMVRRYGLRKIIRKYSVYLLRDTVEVTADRIIKQISLI